MWNLSDTDKRIIDRQIRREEKQHRALKMAKARGAAAKTWLAENKLTPETKAEFDSVMKKVNNSFK